MVVLRMPPIGGISRKPSPLVCQELSGVKFLRMEADRTVLEVEAGSYQFASGVSR